MTFKKGHKFGYVSDEPLDRKPLTIKLRVGLREEIEAIPEWRSKLRELLETWANEQN
jgi:hypothetical protein